MSKRHESRARARLTTYLIGVSLMAVVVAAIGWRLLQEDRTLQRQQIADRLETAADLVSVALRDAIAETRARLDGFASADDEMLVEASAWAERLPHDTVVVAFERDGVRAWPTGRLLYWPVDAPSNPTPPGVFSAGERLEFRERNPLAAAAQFARLGESADPEIQAGGLLRLARTLRKAGRHHEALAAYERLLDCGDVAIAGRPATLLALHGRMATWQELGDETAAAREADLLLERLRHPDWSISRGTFESSWESAEGVLVATGAAPKAVDEALLTAPRAVEALWTEWRAGRDPRASALAADIRPPLVVALAAEEQWIGLVGGAAFVDAMLETRAASVLDRHRASVVLFDRDGRQVAGVGPGEPGSMPVARRTAAEAGLPWTIGVSSVDFDGELALLAGRRRLLAIGLVLMVALVVAGGVLSVQSVRRDLRVASLKSNLMAAVSHEFRTPLTLMRQTTEALADGRIDDEATRQAYYGRQLRATDRLQRLVEGVLDFGRLEAGAFELVARPFDASEWATAVVRSFNDELGDTALPVGIETGARIANVTGDRDALTRVLWNLLDNAVKYSPAGSRVEVGVEADAERVTVAVRDRGPGVDSGEEDAIFEKFTRGRQAIGRAQGSGLGLAMAREVARAHGGDVTVRTRPGGGSVFVLSLPLGGTR